MREARTDDRWQELRSNGTLQVILRHRLVTDEANEVTENHFFNPIVTAGLPPILVSLFTGM